MSFWDGPDAPPPIDAAAVTPSVADVATLEIARCQDANGNDMGTFTGETFPTDTQVSALIDAAVAEVLAQLAPNCDVGFYPSIKQVVALRAAALTELSAFRVEVVGRRDASGSYREADAVYRDALAALQAKIPIAHYVG
ncbi:MAG: hypothetical protein J2O48_01760 [Solirubrobacterales bacterium]|nr:hypothetical protein [Solirubrobacterales bacterium]